MDLVDGAFQLSLPTRLRNRLTVSIAFSDSPPIALSLFIEPQCSLLGIQAGQEDCKLFPSGLPAT